MNQEKKLFLGVSRLTNKDEKKTKAYLYGVELSKIKHISSFRHNSKSPPHLATSLRVPNAGADLRPVAFIRNAILEPTRVVLQIILGVSPVQHVTAGPFVRDRVGEDDEPYQRGDDEEHDEEVEAHEESVAVTGASETSEGDGHYGDPNDYEGPLQELEAVSVVGPGAQPYSSS